VRIFGRRSDPEGSRGVWDDGTWNSSGVEGAEKVILEDAPWQAWRSSPQRRAEGSPDIKMRPSRRRWLRAGIGGGGGVGGGVGGAGWSVGGERAGRFGRVAAVALRAVARSERASHDEVVI